MRLAKCQLGGAAAFAGAEIRPNMLDPGNAGVGNDIRIFPLFI